MPGGKTYNDYLHDYVYGADAPIPLNMHFPAMATDVDLPIPHITGLLTEPGIVEHWGRSNMSLMWVKAMDIQISLV